MERTGLTARLRHTRPAVLPRRTLRPITRRRRTPRRITQPVLAEDIARRVAEAEAAITAAVVVVVRTPAVEAAVIAASSNATNTRDGRHGRPVFLR